MSAVDLYARRLERAAIDAQRILVRAIEPRGISERRAISDVLAVLDDPDLLSTMVRNGALDRHPDALLLQLKPYRGNRDA